MRGRTAFPLAVLAGVLSALAFDPWAVPYAMVAAVALLFWMARRMRHCSARFVLLVGALYGLTFMGLLIRWMTAVSSGAYVALVLAETVFLAFTLLGLRAAARLPGWPVALAATWVLGEMVRGAVPFSGFPWGRLVHTAIDTPFAPYVRLLGMPGTSFILALVAGLLVVIVQTRGRRHVPILAGGVLALALVGVSLPTGEAGNAGRREVAVVQGGVPGAFLTWRRGEIGELHLLETARLVNDVTEGRRPAPDLVLWPENALDVDPYHDADLAARIQEFSAQLDAPILVGGLFDGPTTDTAYNAGVVWDADGPGERYVKRKLVPYGEYVPFRAQLGTLVPRVDRDIPRDMLPGDQSGALFADRLTVADTICWDVAYDGIVHEAVRGGGQVLVVQTSNASFTGTAQPDQQFKISRLRAIETGRWLLVPSTNGVSGIANADGEVVETAPLGDPTTLSAEIVLGDALTPALRYGRPLGWLISAAGALAVAGSFLARRKENRAHAGRHPDL